MKISFFTKCMIFGLVLLHIDHGNAQVFEDVNKLLSMDLDLGDNFGSAVDISGDFCIIGAGREEEDTAGNNTLSAAGAAYIFEKSVNGQWNQVKKLVASDREKSDRFGVVSISGNYAIVGASAEDDDSLGLNRMFSAGSAYIFERNINGNWHQVQKIVALDRASWDGFGSRVSMKGDLVLIAAPSEDEDAQGNNTRQGAGSAYFFQRGSDGIWRQIQKITPSDRTLGDAFGTSICLHKNLAIIGAGGDDQDTLSFNRVDGAGSAYIFEKDSNGVWVERQKIFAADRGIDDNFGTAVAISNAFAVVGARFEEEDSTGSNTVDKAGSAYVFRRTQSGKWVQSQKLTAFQRDVGDEFGSSLALSNQYLGIGTRFEDHDADGNNFVNAAGSVFIYNLDSSRRWNPFEKLVAPNRANVDFFGVPVAISDDRVIAGASGKLLYSSSTGAPIGQGAAYIFEFKDQPSCSANQTTVSNSTWLRSTQKTFTNRSGFWNGVNGNLPADSTFILSADTGSPYPFPLIEILDSSQILKTGSNITFFKKEFTLLNTTNVNARFQILADDQAEIYLNRHRIALMNSFGRANYKFPAHDVRFDRDGTASNGFNGGDAFGVVTSAELDTIFKLGLNEIIIAVRNLYKPNDKGGFSFRMNLDCDTTPPLAQKQTLVSDFSESRELEIFPNPTYGKINVVLPTIAKGKKAEISIQSVQGRILSNQTFSEVDSAIQEFDLSEYDSGLYLLRWQKGEDEKTFKIVKE